MDSEIDAFKSRERAVTKAREEILGLAQSPRTSLATSFADLLGDGGPCSKQLIT
jgi:hypothetical protein